jgi:hypothetical protein
MSSTKFIGDIELLDFNDVIGRNFDILSISNLSFSTFYNFSKSSVLLDNKSKLLLNKLLDESIFIVNDVDNHKKYLSIEHLKFLAACNSCSGNLLISCSLFDVNNKEKHISESLIIIINSLFSVNILVKQKIIISNLKLIISSLNKKLLNISYSSTYYFINEYTFNILKKFIIKNKINSYQFFHRNNFQLQSDYLMRKYPIKLGLLSKHPITPTFVESVAKCKFKAFVEKFLFKNKIETLNLNLLIGKLAHTILMIFFNNRINKNIFSSRFNSTDKEYLFSILDKYSNKFLLKFKYFNKLKVKLRIQRLRDSLLRMFYKQSKNNKMLNFFPKKCEYSIGINYIRYKIKPVPVSFGKYMVYFGGIIDRIDESDDKILLIDYKLSSISSLRFNLSKNNIFKRHFQIPLYSFLLKNTWESVTKNVNSCLLSINDGIMSQIVNFDEIYKNDNSAKSIYDNILISSLINTLEPFFHGVIRPTNSDICYNCKLSIACRVSCVQ